MSNQNQDEAQPMEVLQQSTVQALEAAHIDIQVQTAHKYPRSMEAFKKRALAMVQMDEDTAESCIYVRPVGKEQDKVTGKWIEKYAEGPSVRLAEIVSTSYGNIRVNARIIEQTERYVKCEGVCHDLESNAAGKAEVVESTVKSNGEPYGERQRALMAKVCISKAYRDAIFRIVPRALCKPMMEAAKRIINGTDKPLAERIKRVQSWLQSKKIDDARVFAALNVKGWAEVTPDHLTIITGLKTAITDGEMPIDEAFPPVAKTPEATGMQQSQAGKTSGTAANAAKPADKAPQTGKPATASISPTPASNVVQMPTGAQTTPAAAQTGAEETPRRTNSQTLVEEPLKPAENAEQTGNAAPGAPAAAEPAQGTGEASEAELGAAGLAPQATGEAQAPGEPFVPNPAENEALQNIRFLCHQHGISEDQLMAWCKAPSQKLAKDGQKLADISTQKLLNMGRLWQSSPVEFRDKVLATQ